MNEIDTSNTRTADRVIVNQNYLIRQVYTWMGIGLTITAFMALTTLSSPAILNAVLGNRLVFYGLMIGELALVFILSGAINKLSAAAATLIFTTYSALNGITLSVVAMAYTSSSITSTFVTTAGMFGAMSFYGYLTKRDLTSWGSFLFMGLIGVVIASLVNIFLRSEAIYWVVTYAGVIVFVGLTAYDAQQIKAMALQGFGDEESERKGAVIGALRLYLDFVNLFLMLLNIFGRRR